MHVCCEYAPCSRRQGLPLIGCIYMHTKAPHWLSVRTTVCFAFSSLIVCLSALLFPSLAVLTFPSLPAQTSYSRTSSAPPSSVCLHIHCIASASLSFSFAVQLSCVLHRRETSSQAARGVLHVVRHSHWLFDKNVRLDRCALSFFSWQCSCLPALHALWRA